MRNLNIHTLIDHANLTPLHRSILFWCTLIIIFDGYDLVIYGVVLPILMKTWSLDPVTAGVLGSTALFGMMAGAMGLGMLSDKIGRKKMIILCIVLFSGFTVLNGFAQTPLQFGIMRFIAGLGIGGVMPNVVALMSEYSPKRIRSTLVAVMFSGYGVGGIMSAGLGIWIVPNYGWQVMFYLAAVPLLLLPVIIRALPDSVAFLLKNGRTAEARKVMQMLVPNENIRETDVLILNEAESSHTGLAHLVTEGRLGSTLGFWCAFFMCLLMIYALGSWLPKLMTMAGYGLSSSLMFLLALNIGGIIGAVSGGYLSDRFHPKPVLVAFFLTGAAAIGLLGFETPQTVLYLLVTVAGSATIGSQILLYAYVARFYPTTIRSTGLGWASGIGRTGAIIGPMLGGTLLAMALPHHMNFIIFAIPGLIAASAIAVVSKKYAAD
ncbi:aromatic acid/H+ symport family MFS transporter [Neisseria leonii]|uniref:MFS transporter n=1 Tax=Neisseria leonii TaxID=2995413 RepID=UPI00237AB4D2|nr:aromatic acid/H+ symport family MFS transporter [Neisseria sp. 3986]MDD9325039.1 aromatic acid/H+ symport family MFS transporter [Neisseria sp. 3986]